MNRIGIAGKGDEKLLQQTATMGVGLTCVGVWAFLGPVPECLLSKLRAHVLPGDRFGALLEGLWLAIAEARQGDVEGLISLVAALLGLRC